jgi:hypothetical protein
MSLENQHQAAQLNVAVSRKGSVLLKVGGLNHHNVVSVADLIAICANRERIRLNNERVRRSE